MFCSFFDDIAKFEWLGLSGEYAFNLWVVENKKVLRGNVRQGPNLVSGLPGYSSTESTRLELSRVVEGEPIEDLVQPWGLRRIVVCTNEDGESRVVGY